MVILLTEKGGKPYGDCDSGYAWHCTWKDIVQKISENEQANTKKDIQPGAYDR